MARLSTLPDDDLKGNEADSRDLAQRHADNLYKSAPSSEKDADAAELARMEQAEAEGEGDRSLADATPEERRAALASQENPEDDSNPFQYKRTNYSTNRIGTKLKKKGASGAMLALLVLAFFGVGGGTTLLGSSLLVNLKEIFHNDRADGTRANEIFSRAEQAHQINYNAVASCGRVAIKCRMGTMSDNQLKNFENAGMKVKGDVFDASGKKVGTYEDGKITLDSGEDPGTDTSKYRYISRELTFPDGKTVDSGPKFFEWTSANVKARYVALKAFNPRSAFFENTRFGNFLKNSFDFVKGRTLSGKTKADIDKSFNEQTGGSSEEELKAGKASATRTSRVVATAKDAIGGKSGAATLAAGGACQIYNKVRLAVAAMKMARLVELVKFTLPWLQAADQIKDQGSISPETVDNLSSRLTSYDPNKTIPPGGDVTQPNLKPGDPNPKYGLTATDSQGYAIAEYGDTSALKDFAQQWLLGAGIAGQTSKQLYKISSFNGTFSSRNGSLAIRYFCKALTSVTALIGSGILAIGSLADCASTAVLNAQGLQGCLLAIGIVSLPFVVAFAASQAIDYFSDDLIKEAVDESRQLNLGSDLNGVDAGNAMAAGAGLMLGANATASGLRPSTSVEETQQYIADTNDVNNEYIAAEQYGARDTPFDVNNQYSFLGSIVSNLQLAGNENHISNPLFASLANMNSLIFSAFDGSGTANALYSQPAYSQKERYDCQDEDLSSIGVIGDKFCSIATLMPTDDLNAAQAEVDGKDTIDDVIDYMLKEHTETEEQGGTADDSGGGDQSGTQYALNPFSGIGNPNSTKASIDENGKPVPGSQYSLYLEYCTDARVTPASQTTWAGEPGSEAYWGTTTKEIEKDSNRDQLWYSGEQCTKNSKMMHMFRQYTNYCLQIATMDGTDNCWDTTTAAASLTTSNAGVCGLLNNPNISFANPNTVAALKQNCAGQTVTNVCGQQMMVSAQLANTITTLSSKYKILINNFGFQSDRTGCDSGQHPKGKAIDINEIEMADGSGGTGKGITYGDPAKDKIISQYATDWLNTLPPGDGGVGQAGCSSTYKPTLPSGFLSGNFFSDSCDHLHIDVRGTN